MSNETTIILKNSSLEGAKPTETDLFTGEVALSLFDGQEDIWVKNSKGEVINLRAPRADLMWEDFFKKYETKEEFNSDLDAGNISETSVVFISETGEIWNSGEYYTSSGTIDPEDLEEALSGKQDTLTAGDGIVIEDNTITALESSLTESLEVTGVTIGGLSDGDVIPAGTSLEDILMKMLVQEIDVTSTNPTLKLASNISTGTYEVGTLIEPVFTATYSDGTFNGNSGYSYSISAGCEADQISYYGGGQVLESNTDIYVVSEGSRSYYATVPYSDSTNTPITNLGNPSDEVITAGTATSSTLNYLGKYKYFIGCTTKSLPEEMTSDEIRGLELYSGDLNVNSLTTTMGSNAIYSDGSNVVITCPAKYELTKVVGELELSLLEAFVNTDPAIVEVQTGELITEYRVYLLEILGGASIKICDVEFNLVEE